MYLQIYCAFYFVLGFWGFFLTICDVWKAIENEKKTHRVNDSDLTEQSVCIG